jgi:trehalose 6-phosphate synthase
MSRLIVVSNRVTVAAGQAASQGGLAMGLGAALRKFQGLWFGWSGETTEHFNGRTTSIEVEGAQVVTVDLEEQDVQEYYDGYANRTIWPLFHYRIDLTEYDRSFGQGYERVNRRFAETLKPLLEPDDLIWVHDYHLFPLGRRLRRLGVTNPIGFFLHIPWPARQLMTTLPFHARLVEALFDYDLVGFQTQDWLEAFKDYVISEAGGRTLPGDRLSAYGRTVRTGAFPIGIDAEEFEKIVRSPTAVRTYDLMAANCVFQTLVVGVDRLDYSKGLEERLYGFEQLLKDHPEYRGRTLLLQIAPPTRESVGAYQEIRASLEAQCGRINGEFAETDWAPIRYVHKSYRRDELAGIYRAAKVGLVTPLRDGMNLVAKEYVAAQNPRDPGVLILSCFAGAAAQMREALIVNPFSREEMSEALHRALSMELPERLRRWEALIEGVRRDDITAWRDSFVAALREARGVSEPGEPSPEALERLRAQELRGPRELSDAPPVAAPDRVRGRDPGAADTNHVGRS